MVFLQPLGMMVRVGERTGSQAVVAVRKGEGSAGPGSWGREGFRM